MQTTLDFGNALATTHNNVITTLKEIPLPDDYVHEDGERKTEIVHYDTIAKQYEGNQLNDVSYFSKRRIC